MIPRLNSEEINKIFDETVQSIEQVELEAEAIRGRILRQLQLVRNENEYVAEKAAQLPQLLFSAGNNPVNKELFAHSVVTQYSQCDLFGCTAFARSTAAPYNLFNFIAPTTVLFKDNMTARVNGTAQAGYLLPLKHESLQGYEVFLIEQDAPELVYEIEVAAGKLSGDTLFNQIELAPYLAGSFQIEQLEIWQINDYLLGRQSPSVVLEDVTLSGKGRIVLPEPLQLWKIKFHIRLLWQNAAGKYPFGLKHLYFYHASYAAESYAVLKFQRNSYIEWVSSEIRLHTCRGIETTTCAEKGIKLYLSVTDDGVFEYPVVTSSGSQPIALPRNAKQFFVKVPLDTQTGYIGLEFLQIGLRQ